MWLVSCVYAIFEFLRDLCSNSKANGEFASRNSKNGPGLYICTQNAFPDAHGAKTKFCGLRGSSRVFAGLRGGHDFGLFRAKIIPMCFRGSSRVFAGFRGVASKFPKLRKTNGNLAMDAISNKKIKKAKKNASTAPHVT